MGYAQYGIETELRFELRTLKWRRRMMWIGKTSGLPIHSKDIRKNLLQEGRLKYEVLRTDRKQEVQIRIYLLYCG